MIIQQMKLRTSVIPQFYVIWTLLSIQGPSTVTIIFKNE